MLTRGAVAKRLGKSIATVRRLEQHGLVFTIDDRGVHRFSEPHVDTLVERLKNGEKILGAQGAWLGVPHADRRRITRESALALRRLPRAEVTAIVKAAQSEVASEIIELCTPRQLRHLGPDATAYLDILLDD